jgi:hypothetical protein
MWVWKPTQENTVLCLNQSTLIIKQ